MADPRKKTDFYEHLTAYAQGELSSEKQRELEDLLKTSPEARREVAEINELLTLCASIPDINPSAALEQQLVLAFAEPQAEPGVESLECGEPGWIQSTLDMLLLLPAFIRFQLQYSGRIRGLGVLTAAFAIHAVVLTLLTLVEMPNDRPVSANLPRANIECIEHMAPTGVSREAIPASEGFEVVSSDDDLWNWRPDPELILVETAAPIDAGSSNLRSGLPIDHERLNVLNQRALRRLNLIARFDPVQRDRALATHGGGKETEAIVTRALDWLGKAQEEDGSFSPSRYEGYSDNQVGVTGLAALAFLGHGSSSTYGLHQDSVAPAIAFLRNSQDETGAIGPRNRSFLYGHAIATLALLEDFVLKSASLQDVERRREIEKAVDLLENAQNSDGGWGYLPGAGKSDLSSSCWQILALSEAQKCGFDVDPKIFNRFKGFVTQHRNPDGTVNYALEEPTSGSSQKTAASRARLTAAAWLASMECRSILELPGFDEISEPLDQAFSNLGSAQKDYHLAFFGMATRVQNPTRNPAEWSRWNQMVQRVIATWQEQDGSCSPQGDPYGQAGGRIYATSLAALALESYYR